MLQDMEMFHGSSITGEGRVSMCCFSEYAFLCSGLEAIYCNLPTCATIRIKNQMVCCQFDPKFDYCLRR